MGGLELEVPTLTLESQFALWRCSETGVQSVPRTALPRRWHWERRDSL
jgi:hypothetical protein